MEFTQPDFNLLVHESIEALDLSIRIKCQNIEFELKPTPSSEELLGTGVENPLELLSLHEKIPHTNSYGYEKQIPEKIILFQKSIENVCSSEEEAKKIITQTVLSQIYPSDFNELIEVIEKLKKNSS